MMKIDVIISNLPAPMSRRELAFSQRPNDEELRTRISDEFGIMRKDFYMIQNGRSVGMDTVLDTLIPVVVNLKVLGGKGGFGSMLRAIGAQIEKTTNRDACRDLSGRRLRDINEEQRLKRWFAKQAEREREREEKRQEKLEKLRRIQDGPPLPLMDDVNYNQQRADMSDSVFDAVDKGFEASKKKRNAEAGSGSEDSSPGADTSSSEDLQAKPSSSSSVSVAAASSSKPPTQPPKKKLKKLMMDEEFDTGSSSSDSEGETAVVKK